MPTNSQPFESPERIAAPTQLWSLKASQVVHSGSAGRALRDPTSKKSKAAAANSEVKGLLTFWKLVDGQDVTSVASPLPCDALREHLYVEAALHSGDSKGSEFSGIYSSKH
jgi:hypothetical protein